MLSFQVLFAAVGYVSVVSFEKTLTSVFKVRLPSIEALVQADRDFQQALVAERTLLLSEGLTQAERAELAKEYLENRKQVKERFDVYTQLAEHPDEQRVIKEFNSNYQKWITQSDEVLGISESGQFLRAPSLANAREASIHNINQNFEASRKKLDELQELVLQFGESEYLSAESQFKFSTFVILGFSALGTLLSALIAFLITRRINVQITEVAQTLSAENHHLIAISNLLGTKAAALASASQQQSSSVVETSSSLEEISKMIQVNTDTSVKSAELTSETRDLMTQGLADIEALGHSLGLVQKTSEELAGKVDASNAELEKVISAFHEVSEKTKVINDIVFQTKLLSFNASVEAARAGEHGKGFSVVAEEIGKLAEMSGNSAAEINTLLSESLENVSRIIDNSKTDIGESVSESRSKVDESMTFSHKCESTLQTVLEMSKIVNQSAESIANASKEQWTGVNEINTAMQEISTSNQLTSQSAEEVDHSSDELRQAVDKIGSGINTLKKLVGTFSTDISNTPHATTVSPLSSQARSLHSDAAVSRKLSA